MFTHKHYVPILKTKAGEQWAIGNLKGTSAAHLTPLLELHSPPKPPKPKTGKPQKTAKPVTLHAEEICEAFAGLLPSGKQVFLDLIWLEPTAKLISDIFASARAKGLRAIPVARVDLEPAELDEIGKVAAADGRGCMIRVRPADLVSPLQIEAVAKRLGTKHSSTDLLIDYGKMPMSSLPQNISQIPSLKKWRTLTAASGVFPTSIADQPLRSWFQIDRTDWSMWEAFATTAKLDRIPTFGDYATRSPGRPSGFGSPSVHVRYTKETDWFVHQDGKQSEGDAPNMHQICKDLVGMSIFDGPAFSAGDREIAAVARRLEKPGNATHWTQWGISHHLEFAVQQIQSHPAL